MVARTRAASTLLPSIHHGALRRYTTDFVYNKVYSSYTVLLVVSAVYKLYSTRNHGHGLYTYTAYTRVQRIQDTA